MNDPNDTQNHQEEGPAQPGAPLPPPPVLVTAAPPLVFVVLLAPREIDGVLHTRGKVVQISQPEADALTAAARARAATAQDLKIAGVRAE